jgi:hypothetical protein
MANNAQAHQQPPEPSSELKSLGERLVGTWEMSGEVQGTVTYEWMEGGFFLIQHVDLEQYGQKIKGIEIIGHARPFGAAPSEEIKSRFYSNTGDTLDYVYELEGNTLANARLHLFRCGLQPRPTSWRPTLLRPTPR